MKIIVFIIVAAIAQIFLPWWIIAPLSFVWAIWNSEDALKSYGKAALSMALLWAAYAIYLNNISEGLMLEKIGNLFSENIKSLKNLPATPTFLFIMALIGSQVAGISALAGHYFKQLMK